MTMSDPIADMLTRIRNGQQAGLYSVSLPYSRHLGDILDVLKREGFIRNYFKQDAEGKPQIKVELKYIEGQAAIKIIKRVSKPGRRVYSKIGDLQKYFNGLGISILSTSKGVLSDYEATREKIGGEVLCYVF